MKIKFFAILLSIVLTAASLSSCSLLRSDGESASTAGVQRDDTTESDKTPVAAGTEDTSGEDTADTTADTDGKTDGTSAVEPDETDSDTAQGGEYAGVADKLNFPSDLSFLNAISKAHFSDKNPDDPNGCWYPGKVTRDLTTGNVTYNWDRAAGTLALIDKYGAIYRGNDERKYVYLTFDCGYEYRCDAYPDGVTNDILDTLKEKNAPGTFFVTGDYLNTDSDIVKRMLDEGHIVGTHTYHHYNMTTITPETFVEEIKLNNDLLKKKIPTAPDMTFYRPPEGGANEWTLALAAKMGLTTTFWSATVADYNTSKQPDPATTLNADKTMLHNGCVYLLHAVSTTNAQILGELIDYIRAEGYEIRALSEFVR